MDRQTYSWREKKNRRGEIESKIGRQTEAERETMEH